MSYTDKMRASHAKSPMTRRDYELIAHCLKEARKGSLELYQVNGLCEDFADELSHQPGFDRERFLRACGCA